MKNNKKRGFTLVELLVVIAILAILATVSVVGYTSFIESAAVSNDENVAAQLNNFMIAIKADHTSEFYNQEVTPENARDFVYEALVLGGLDGQLKPEAANYGYHFYYDLKEDKIVVLDNAIDDGALLKNVLASLGVLAVNYDILDNPATCFTKQDAEFTKYNGIRYVFLDNDGSELAELINLFYNVNSAKDFARLQELATKAIFDGKKVTTLEKLVNKSIFVGSSGSYMTAEGEKTLFFGRTMYSDKFVGSTPVDSFKNPTAPIHVSSLIKFFATNSLTFETPYSDTNSAVVLHFDYTLNELVKIVDPDFTNVAFTLADGKKYVCENGAIKCLDDANMTPVEVGAKNPMLSFDIIAESVKDGKVHSKGTNTANIAMESGIKLTLTNVKGEFDDKYNFVSSTNVEWTITSVVVGDTTITDETQIKNYVTVDADGNLTFVAICDKVNVTATAKVPNSKGAATQNFVFDVARVTAGSVKLFNTEITAGTTGVATLVKTPDKDNYTIVKIGDYSYQNEDGITFDESITWTYEGTGVGAIDGALDTIKLTGKGSGVLTIKVGTYLTYKVNLTIEDATNFTLQPKNLNNFTFLGSKNDVLVSDLFELKGEIPEGAELVVYNGAVQEGDSYMTPKRGKLTNQINAEVEKNTQTLTKDNFSTLTLKFSGEDLNNSVRIAVVHNGVRISEDVEVKIVDAYNITDYSQIHTWTVGTTTTGEWVKGDRVEISTLQSTNKVEVEKIEPIVSGKTLTIKVTYTKYTDRKGILSATAVKHTQIVTHTYTTEGIANGASTITDNIVLLKNIEMPNDGYSMKVTDENGMIQGANNALTISGKTIYGNCFTFDITNGTKKNVNGIVVLSNAHMQDLKVVGSMYPVVKMSGMEEYGTNAVHALGTSTINNCYIANCRAPLATGYENNEVHNVTVSNSVIYGGIYANIEHRGGTLTFGENVITINQPHTTAENTSTATDKKAGLGVTVWLDAPMTGTSIQGMENLTQYNFISSSYQNLPTVSITASVSIITLTANISTQNAFNQAFDSSDIYKFDGKYVNTGVTVQDVGKDNSELIKSIISSKVLPYGDRSGLQANANMSSTTLSVPVTMMGYSPSDAFVHLYAMKQTEANEQIFADSANAECIYSPWKQSFTVETDTTTTTTTCEAYGFDTNGSIVPTDAWLAKLMTSTTTNK